MFFSRLGPIVHIIAGLVPLFWIHAVQGGDLLNLNPGLMVLCAFVALLPDIDTHSSVIGRLIPEVSRYIERHYGHRSITHSVAANLVILAISYLLAPDWLALTLAYSSHLVVDMIVGGNAGVPLFWPAPWRFKLMHIVPESRGELTTGSLFLALALLPMAVPAAAAEVTAIIPRQPTPTATKTPTLTPTVTSTPTPVPTLVSIRIQHVYDVESEILVQAGDVITVGQQIADLHTLRAQLLRPQVPTPMPPTDLPTIAVEPMVRSGVAPYRIAIISTEIINVRSGPGLQHGILATAQRGQSFPVVGEQDGWVQIRYAEETAWLYGELVTLSEGTTARARPGVDSLTVASAWADLQVARAVATKAFSPPDPTEIQTCNSQLEAMRNALWQAQLSRDAAKIKANEPGASTPWETIGAMEAGLAERERQITEQEVECARLAHQPYVLDEFDRQIAAARLQQAELVYAKRVATPTLRPTPTPTYTPTPRPTATAAPLADVSDTYIASLVAGDVHAVKIVSVNGNQATVQIDIAIGYGVPEPTVPLLDNAVIPTGTGHIDVLFTQSGINVEQALIARIEAAQSSIDIAAFEFNLDRVANALIEAHKRSVQVRWITDDEHGIEADHEPGHGQFARLQAVGIEVRDDDRSALMHNKFWIFDSALVWTGSTNITLNGTQRNNNNVIVFESPEVAAIYQAEFDEMWAGRFGANSPSQLGNQAVELDGTRVEVLFGPEDNVASRLVELILAAQESIHFMAFSFTHDDMGIAIQQKAQELGDVRGIFEARGSGTEYSELTRLHCQSAAEVRTDGNLRTFHHKVIVIDGDTTITGSFNFSANANERNDENLVIVWSEAIAAAYVAEFERRWAEASPPGVACP